MTATSLGEWFFYAVSGGILGYMVIGTVVVLIRELWGFLRNPSK